MGRVVLGGEAMNRADLALGKPVAWRRLADASRVLRDDDVGEADEEADRADRQDHAVRGGSHRRDVAARQDLEHLADRYHAAGGDRLVDGQIGSRRRTPARPHGGRHCRGNGHDRCCNRQRVIERRARAASHLRCEMRAETQGLPRFGPPEGKDLLLLDCIMEVAQWTSSAARRRVAWVYDGTYLYSPYREVYIGSPPLGFTYLNRFS